MCGVKRPTHGIKPCLNLIYLILDNSNQQETIIEYFPGDDLESARQRIADFLGQKLRLRLRPKKTHISACEKGITLLGQRVFCTHRLLLKPNVRRFYKCLRKRLRDFREGKLHPDKLEAQLNSWLGHAKQADTYRLRQKILRQLVFEALAQI